MNTATGEIKDYSEVLDMKAIGDPAAKFYKPVPAKYAGMLQGMNRAQRREWYRKNKKLFKPTA